MAMANSRWSDPEGMRTKRKRRRRRRKCKSKDKRKCKKTKWEDLSDLMLDPSKSDIDTSNYDHHQLEYLEVNNLCWRMTITPSDISTPMLTAAEF